MRVAVTGGSGVVGRTLVRHLVQAGHEIRALARTDEAAENLDWLGARPVPGDVLDESSLERLVAGCEWVFHVAGVNEMCSRDPARMWRVNVDGSLLVLEASTRSGVRRLIHTSSAATIGEPPGHVGSEKSAHRGYFLSEYERSKTEAERLLLGTQRDIEVVSVNPSSVQGPGRATGTGALLLAGARGRLPIAVDATFSVVDIDDCARGHLLAAERGVAGERYILSGAVASVRDVVRSINMYLGRRSRPWFIKPGALGAAAPVVDVVSRLLRRQSPLCPESARVLLHGNRYDGSRATRELDLVYTPLEVTVELALAWFQDEKLI